MAASAPGRALPWVLAAGILIAFQALIPGPDRSMLWRALFDAGHAPLYGLIALALLQAIRRVSIRTAAGRRVSGHRWAAYGSALALASLIGVAMEAIQFFGGRDADPLDALRNVVGAAAVLAVALAVDRRARPAAKGARWGLIIAAGLMLAVVFVPVASLGLAYLQRRAAFPTLSDFEDSWERRFVGGRDAELDRLPAPPRWELEQGEQAGRIRFLPAQYPALILSEPYPDWTGFSQLKFEAYSEESEPLRLELRIHDAKHNQEYRDRFNTVLVLRPGANQVGIDLEKVRQAPQGRLMDMKQIRNVTLFRVSPEDTSVVWVDRIRLE